LRGCAVSRLRGCAVARLRGSALNKRHQMFEVLSPVAMAIWPETSHLVNKKVTQNNKKSGLTTDGHRWTRTLKETLKANG